MELLLVGSIALNVLLAIGLYQANQRIGKLEGLITLHALGENLIQGEAKAIKGR